MFYQPQQGYNKKEINQPLNKKNLYPCLRPCFCMWQTLLDLQFNHNWSMFWTLTWLFEIMFWTLTWPFEMEMTTSFKRVISYCENWKNFKLEAISWMVFTEEGRKTDWIKIRQIGFIPSDFVVLLFFLRAVSARVKILTGGQGLEFCDLLIFVM